MRFPIVAVLLLAAALVTGCTSEPRSSPERQINKSLTLKQTGTSAVATLVSVVEHYVDATGEHRPNSGNFVVVNLRLDNATSQFSTFQLNLSLKTSSGTVGLESNALVAVPPDKRIYPRFTTPLMPGSSLTGLMTFDAQYDSAATFRIADSLGYVIAEWPLSGGEPTTNLGAPKRTIDKSLTATQSFRRSSMVVTLLSIAESRGGGHDFSSPESGTFVVAELRVEGKAGVYFFDTNWVRLRKPDGTLVGPRDGHGTAGVPRHEQFVADKVGPGEVATGSIAFDSELEPGAKIVLTDATDEITGEWPL